MTVPYDTETRTFDCDPTLTDTRVLDFCRQGFIVLQGVVPDDVNRRTIDYLEGKIPANPMYIPAGLTEADLERIRGSHEPSTIFLEDWFLDHVLLNPALAGVMRSLLGKNVGLPVLVSHHRSECPGPAQVWHHDADRVFGPELEYVEVFYFPQDTPVAMGPTEIVPGSHFRMTQRDADEGGVFVDGPAGTLGIHHQSILHRRGAATASGIRHMLKYNYWRTTPPTRDWIIEEDFDFHTAYYGGHNEAIYVGHMFHWLCGLENEYRLVGGQGWPWSTANVIGPSYGYRSRGRYLPDWRRGNPDGYVRKVD